MAERRKRILRTELQLRIPNDLLKRVEELWTKDYSRNQVLVDLIAAGLKKGE